MDMKFDISLTVFHHLAECQMCMTFGSILYRIGGEQSMECQISWPQDRWEISFFALCWFVLIRCQFVVWPHWFCIRPHFRSLLYLNRSLLHSPMMYNYRPNCTFAPLYFWYAPAFFVLSFCIACLHCCRFLYSL